MGKGDKKTKRGKIFQGSYGVRRRKKADKSSVKATPAAKETRESKPARVKKEKVEEPKTAKEKAPRETKPKAEKPEKAEEKHKEAKPKKEKKA